MAEILLLDGSHSIKNME
jgi:hypothetical protein